MLCASMFEISSRIMLIPLSEEDAGMQSRPTDICMPADSVLEGSVILCPQTARPTPDLPESRDFEVGS